MCTVIGPVVSQGDVLSWMFSVQYGAQPPQATSRGGMPVEDGDVEPHDQPSAALGSGGAGQVPFSFALVNDDSFSSGLGRNNCPSP